MSMLKKSRQKKAVAQKPAAKPLAALARKSKGPKRITMSRD